MPSSLSYSDHTVDFTTSRFNTDPICLACAEAERRHPDYAKACEAELAAVRAGDRNFPGIGLPPDLARRP